jgi:hypothetical protein
VSSALHTKAAREASARKAINHEEHEEKRFAGSQELTIYVSE